MKKFLFCFLIGLIFNIGYSQNNQGQISFEEKINIWKNLSPEMEAMKENIPEFKTSKFVMLFADNKTLYTPKKRTDDEKQKAREKRAGERKRGPRFGGRKGGSTYSDLNSNQTKSAQNFFGKDFLITGETRKYKWKLTGKQRQVGEFLCQEASYQDSTDVIKAWFTPMIPVATGPGNYSGLPGMILHMDFNDGQRTITAIDVQLKEIDASLIVEPTEGEKVTREEFDAIKEEKMKEMESEFGGKKGGNRMFIRRG